MPEPNITISEYRIRAEVEFYDGVKTVRRMVELDHPSDVSMDLEVVLNSLCKSLNSISEQAVQWSAEE